MSTAWHPRKSDPLVPAALAPARVLALESASSVGAHDLVGCGLSLSGLEAAPNGPRVDASAGLDASPSGTPTQDGASPDDASVSAIDGGAYGPLDAADDALAVPPDGAADAAHACAPVDAGLTGPLALSSFATVGSASFDESSDGRITLTNSDNDQAGAAWYPTPMPNVNGYDFTWSLRVGPSDTAGDGVAFAVLVATGTLGVGAEGDGIGLRGVTQSGNGGAPAGYAVVVDMFEDQGDPTDLAPTTLKLVTMPAFTFVAETGLNAALNDGNTYAVDVSWRAPSSLTATLHGPGGVLTTVTSADPGLAAPAGTFGFTGATGADSDSHNEIAGITFTDVCD